MAVQTRDELKYFLIKIAMTIQEGADMTDVAEQLERATGIADELASKELADSQGDQNAREFYFRRPADRGERW